MEGISTTVKHLISLASKKAWMREPSSNELCKLIEKLSQLSKGKSIAEEILHSVEQQGLLRTQDGAAILLAMSALPGNVKPKLSTKIWQHAEPLHPSNLMLLSNVLKDIPSEEDTVKQSGIFKGEPHFIWWSIQKRYEDQSKEIVSFRKLWNNVVEGMFLPVGI